MKQILKRLVSGMLITLALGIAIVSYSFNVEPAWVEVVQIQETLPRLSPEFQGFKIAHISDMHVGRLMGKERLMQIVDLVNSQNPDLVVITGDFVTHHPDRYAETLISGLQRLTQNHPTLGVLGNHDYWSDPIEVRRILKASGVLELNNAVHTIQRGGEQLQ
ncbi:MAG: metallophosphoesterase, partial [Cyanobacteria bacterium P01_F01_bin.153]